MTTKIQSYKLFITLALVLFAITPLLASAATGAGITPDSPFYFLDTFFERVDLFFTFSPEKKVKKNLAYAEERLAEAEEVAIKKKPEIVEKTMAKYEDSIATAIENAKELTEKKKSEETLSLISENTSKHEEVLREVLTKVPDEAKSAIQKAIEVSTRKHEQALKEVEALKRELGELKEEIATLKRETEKELKQEIERLRAEKEKENKKPVQVQPEPPKKQIVLPPSAPVPPPVTTTSPPPTTEAAPPQKLRPYQLTEGDIEYDCKPKSIIKGSATPITCYVVIKKAGFDVSKIRLVTFDFYDHKKAYSTSFNLVSQTPQITQNNQLNVAAPTAPIFNESYNFRLRSIQYGGTFEPDLTQSEEAIALERLQLMVGLNISITNGIEIVVQ